MTSFGDTTHKPTTWRVVNHTADQRTTNTSHTGDQMVIAGARVLSQPALITMI